ncbi:uncharacterized protein LOC126907667 [Daktulosphaira vitifoliae]|uniref:uncharacterized protein LOC126907667 n=1 Tax=Daktulosphaira vitifoliae TaxID=58002 RepID=UPI0021A9BF4D|nr:uncharacterized protein LOC126907667 [Daktulosphaira vitifoliae]
MILTKFIFLLHINLMLGLHFHNLQCNFIKYMLNFFNHNNQYLTEISENIKKYDVHSLRTYGNAIKTHSEIVLIMLDVLREVDKNVYSKELMSLNLYLNNVSEYVDFYAKNDDGIFDFSDRTSSILEGYTMIHDFFIDNFKLIISSQCEKVINDEIFIYCPDYNELREYTPENFQYVANKLKNRLLQTNKEQNDTDDNVKSLKHSKVYYYFYKAILRSEYWDFLPKNSLFYDFMMSNCKISEKNLMISSRLEQYSILKNGENINGLDMIRFAPLIIKCPDKSYLTLYDVFRFVKYTFYRKDIQVFHSLIMASTFRPIALLVRIFIKILSGSMYVYNFNSVEEESLKFYENVISVGKIIIACFQNFVDLNLFGGGPTHVFLTFLSKTSECLYHFINNNNTELILSTANLMNSLKLFLNNLKIYVYDLPKYFTKDIVNNLFNELVMKLKQTEELVSELKNHFKCFQVIKKTFKIEPILDLKLTYIFSAYVTDELCQNEGIYTLYNKFNNLNVNQIDDVNEKSSANDYENRNKNITRHQNHPEKYIQNYDLFNLNNCNLFFKYLTDYILFI